MVERALRARLRKPPAGAARHFSPKITFACSLYDRMQALHTGEVKTLRISRTEQFQKLMIIGRHTHIVWSRQAGRVCRRSASGDA